MILWISQSDEYDGAINISQRFSVFSRDGGGGILYPPGPNTVDDAHLVLEL